MKIIDVLNKIADGTLEDGSIVEYDENSYLYDKDDNTLINSEEEEFSYNVMIEEHLNDEVKLYKEVTVNDKIKDNEIGWVLLMGSYDIDIPAIAKKLNEVIDKLNKLIEKTEK